MYSGQSYRHEALGLLLILAGLCTAVTCWADTTWPPPTGGTAKNGPCIQMQDCVPPLCRNRQLGDELALYECVGGNTVYLAKEVIDKRNIGYAANTNMPESDVTVYTWYPCALVQIYDVQGCLTGHEICTYFVDQGSACVPPPPP